MTSRVLLAFPDTAASQARSIAARLGALGYEVGPLTRRARGDKVVMLWSRAAWGTPALRAAARRAHAAGKLVCISLDSAPPPIAGAKLAALPRGGADQNTWRRLLGPRRRPLPKVAPARARIATPSPPIRRPTPPHTQTRVTNMPAPPREKRLNSGLAVFTLLAGGAAAAAYAYTQDASIAAFVDAAIAEASAEAQRLIALAS